MRPEVAAYIYKTGNSRNFALQNKKEVDFCGFVDYKFDNEIKMGVEFSVPLQPIPYLCLRPEAEGYISLC